MTWEPTQFTEYLPAPIVPSVTAQSQILDIPAVTLNGEKVPQPVAQIESNPNLQQLVVKNPFRGLHKSIGVSEYELTRALSDDLKSSLPTVEEIETELSGKGME